MPEVQEVFRMTTQKIRQEPDAPERQTQVQHHREARRKATVFVLVAGLLLVVAAIGLSTATQSRAPAKQPPPSQGIKTTFTPTIGAFIVDLATGGRTSLPTAIAGAAHYAVSPDGTMVAFNPCCSGQVAVSVANMDGTGLRQVNETIDAYGAQWSPDGSSLVYQGRDANTDTVGDLFVVNVATGHTKRITHLPQIRTNHWFMGPSFSPDGTTILFNLPRGDINRTQHWDLWSVPATGGAPTLVMRNAAHGVYAPDGSRIAYLSRPRLNPGGLLSYQLWTARPDGTDPRLLTKVPVNGAGGISILTWARWSPDGTTIAMSGAGEVTLVDVATGATSGAGVNGSLATWINDSSLVVAP
jgi:Tol biopolymer transport system component